MGKLFGTDGIRGRANTYPITPEVALQIGKAVAKVFGASGNGKIKAVIGKDTRLSGYMLETALTSGMISMGMDVLQTGPIPTPAVAHLTRSMCASCGIMITASHNPSEDNGIKVFGPDGFKLSDEVENKIEEYIFEATLKSSEVGTTEIGKAYRIDDARGRYIEFAKSSVDNISLKGLKVVLDCANGAAYSIGPSIFEELGAEVISVATKPDGRNINDACGAMHPEKLSELVLKNKADLGICFDGDADRVICLDEKGKVVNGDRIIGLCALEYKKEHPNKDTKVVITTMSNMGLHKSMEDAGIGIEITDVGDRYVIERMREKGLKIGGEQSGHIIFLDYATTGDGIITALHILKLMAETKKTLSELADFMSDFPQELISINVRRKPPISEVEELVKVIEECEEALGESGRTIVRYSGTENKIRLLVEADTQEKVDEWIEKMSDVVNKELC